MSDIEVFAYQPTDMNQAQFDILWDSLADNPLLPSHSVEALNKQLNTTGKSVIKAINELKKGNDSNKSGLSNFTNLYNNLFGDTLSDPSLQTNIQKIDTNVLKAIYKTYTLIVGNPDEPIDVSELGSNINQCILALKNLIDVKQQEIDKINLIISDIDGLREAVALEDIPAFKVVYMNDNGEVGIADCNNIEHCDNIVGITVLESTTGQKTKYCLRGEVTNPAWSFTKKGTNVFIGRNGELEKSPVVGCGFIQEFGFIVDTNVINIDIEEGIVVT